MTPRVTPFLVWPDDSRDRAGRWCRRRFSILRVENIQIFQARTSVEEHDRIVDAEETAGQQLLVGNQRRRSFGSGENAFYLGPVAGGMENFGVCGGESKASALFQNVENQIVAVGFGDAQAGG
jgi:hypothetical protein